MHDMRDVIHAALTAMLVWFALLFELHSGMLKSDPTLRYFDELASQRVWAVVFLASANLGIIGLVTSRASARLASTLFVSTAHGVFAGCLILAGATLWSGTYAIIALMGYALAFWRTRAGV